LFVFFNVEENRLEIELELIRNLIKKENKKDGHSIRNQGLL